MSSPSQTPSWMGRIGGWMPSWMPSPTRRYVPLPDDPDIQFRADEADKASVMSAPARVTMSTRQITPRKVRSAPLTQADGDDSEDDDDAFEDSYPYFDEPNRPQTQSYPATPYEKTKIPHVGGGDSMHPPPRSDEASHWRRETRGPLDRYYDVNNGTDGIDDGYNPQMGQKPKRHANYNVEQVRNFSGAGRDASPLQPSGYRDQSYPYSPDARNLPEAVSYRATGRAPVQKPPQSRPRRGAWQDLPASRSFDDGTPGSHRIRNEEEWGNTYRNAYNYDDRSRNTPQHQREDAPSFGNYEHTQKSRNDYDFGRSQPQPVPPKTAFTNTNAKGYQYRPEYEYQSQPNVPPPPYQSAFIDHITPFPAEYCTVPVEEMQPNQYPPLDEQLFRSTKPGNRRKTERSEHYQNTNAQPRRPRRNSEYEKMSAAYPADNVYRSKNKQNTVRHTHSVTQNRNTDSDSESSNFQFRPSASQNRTSRNVNQQATNKNFYSSRSSQASDGGRHVKQRDPKMFDGQRIEWSDYIQHFEAVAQWNRWNEDQKAQQLVMSFDGEAMKLLGELSNEILHDYSQLVNELNRRYDPAERAQAYKIEFRHRTRGRHESFMTYAQELKRLVTRAYPTMPSNVHEQFVVDQFISGLGHRELRKHVQFGHPADINQAISLALELEAFDSSFSADGFRKPRAEVNMVRPYSDDDDDDDDDEDSAMACAITDVSGKHKSHKYDKNVSCKYCKKSGHEIESCYKLKNKQEWEAKQNAKNSSPTAEATQQGN